MNRYFYCLGCLILTGLIVNGVSDRVHALQSDPDQSAKKEQQQQQAESNQDRRDEGADEGADERAEQPFQATRFMRLLTDEYEEPEALQTATVKYVLKDKDGKVTAEVFLEGVIHIADSSYYRSFQKRFGRYDSVLYESILKPKSATEDRGEAVSGVQMLQQLSTGTLGLAYQFDDVDYDADNLINADLSAKEIGRRMEERGESGATLLADLLAHIGQKLNSSQDIQVEGKSEDDPGEVSETDEPIEPAEAISKIKLGLSVFTDPDGIMKIRRMMATALVDTKLLESTLPPGIHEMIIGDRNDRAAEVLKSELEKDRKRIAIFFGVGHMADFEKRLVDDFGMQRDSVNWRNAWDLRDGAVEGAPLEGLIESTFRDSFKNKLRNFAKGLTDKKREELEEQAKMKDAQIQAMEAHLKALEAKLNDLQKDSSPTDSKSGEGSTDESEGGDG